MKWWYELPTEFVLVVVFRILNLFAQWLIWHFSCANTLLSTWFFRPVVGQAGVNPNMCRPRKGKNGKTYTGVYWYCLGAHNWTPYVYPFKMSLLFKCLCPRRLSLLNDKIIMPIITTRTLSSFVNQFPFSFYSTFPVKQLEPSGTVWKRGRLFGRLSSL